MVSAGKIPYGLLDIRAFCVQLLTVFIRHLNFQVLIEHPAAADLIHLCQRGILPNRGAQNQAVAFAVLGDVCQLVIDCVLNVVQTDLSAVHQQRSGDIGSIAFSKNTHCKLGAARAHQTADADYLAPANMEIDAVNNLAPLIKRMIDSPIPHFHSNLPNLLVFALWETVCQLPADHSFNNPFLAEIVHTFDQRFDC